MCICCSPLLLALQSQPTDPGRRRFLWGTAALAATIGAGLHETDSAAQTPGHGDADAARFADTLYVGGTIVTVDDARPQAECVAVRRGSIVGVGARDELETRFRGPHTRIVDLQGKTLIPGFIDGHSHIAGFLGLWGLTDLAPPPVGDVTTLAQIIDKVRNRIADDRIPDGSMVIAINYDDTLLAERRHPTVEEADAISTRHPVVLVHISGHLAVANHVALAKAGFAPDRPDPKAGTIYRRPDGSLSGLVAEQAIFPLLALLPPKAPAAAIATLAEVQHFYASHGITTAQEGQTPAGALTLLRAAAAQRKLVIDIVAYPKWTDYVDVMEGRRKLRAQYYPPGQAGNPGYAEPDGKSSQSAVQDVAAPRAHPSQETGHDLMKIGIYVNRLKIAGVKITGDGSPQGKTAFLTQPYIKPPAGETSAYRGLAVVTQDETDRWMDFAYRKHVQVFMHCNGDAAADMMISAIRKAQHKYGKKDLRPVMIHAQVVRPEQVEAMAELGITPSFFTAHTFYWGDWHVNETLGPERAAFISPMKTALARGLFPVNHTDAPVVPPDQIFTIHTAVNRTSRSGQVIGPGERVSPLEALRAVTINGARMYFEEHLKGSITPGKLADFAILSGNPLTVDPIRIKDIRVIETIKEDRTIFRRT